MIVRAILANPDLADNFDFPNDFKDTWNWLHHLPVSHERAVAHASLLDMGLNHDDHNVVNMVDHCRLDIFGKCSVEIDGED